MPSFYPKVDKIEFQFAGSTRVFTPLPTFVPAARPSTSSPIQELRCLRDAALGRVDTETVTTRLLEVTWVVVDGDKEFSIADSGGMATLHDG